MDRLGVDSTWWEIRLWVLSGNHVVFSKFCEIGKKAASHTASHTTSGSQVPRRADESDGLHRRVLAADRLCFFLAAQARKLSLSASLEWAEEALKRHARDSDSDAAIEVLSFSSVFWVDRVVLLALGRPSWRKNCACDRHDFFLRSHRRDTLCYGLYPWARLLSRLPPVDVHDLSPRMSR